MEQRRRMWTRKLVAGAVASTLSALTLVLVPALTDEASAASTKITICHRTHSTTNPYRRITVSQNAVQQGGHGGHDLPNGSTNPAVFDPLFDYQPSNKIWGDVIPGSTNGGNAYNGTVSIALNWTAEGIALFNSARCGAMTAKQFYDTEIAAGESAANVLADLNDQDANEDVAILASIGGTFTAGNVTSWDTAVSVATDAASSVTATTATLNGSITVGAISTAIGFDYGTSSTLATFTSVSAGSNVTSVSARATSAALTGLTPGTTYYYRATGTTNAGTDTEGVLSGSILSFTTTGNTAQAITFTQPTAMAMGGGTQTLTNATADSGLAVTFTSTTPSICTVAGDVVTAVAAGTCSITASQAGNSTYGPATSVTRTFSVTATSRTLTVDAISYDADGYAASATPPTITSTASDGDAQGTKAYGSTTTSVCTVVAATGVVTFVGAGTCTIGATITAGGVFGSATASSISFTVTATARTLAIDAGSYTSGGYAVDATPPTISSTASAGDAQGAKSYSSTTTSVCTVVAATGVVTFVAPGSCTIGATIAASGNHAAATASTITFAVTPLARTLTIDPGSYTPAGHTMGGAAPTITSSPSAGAGTRTYSTTTPTVCTVNANTGDVTLLGPGTCTIGAAVAASGSYAMATATSISFPVAAAASPPPVTTTSTTPTTSTTVPTTTTTSPPTTNTTTPPAGSLTTPDGTVRGTVWFDRNRNSAFDGREWILPGIQVTLTQVLSAAAGVDGFRAAAAPLSFTLPTDKDGRYLFTNLPPGDYKVTAVAQLDGFGYTSDTDGNADWEVTVDVPANQTGIADFAGLGKGQILGQMFEQNTLRGLALANINCMWSGFDDVLGNGDDVSFDVIADGEGRFDMAGVPFGNFNCSGVDAEGRRSASVLAAVFSAEPQTAPLPVSRPDRLPDTGTGIAKLVILGLLALAFGAILLGAERRRRLTKT